LSEVRVTRHFGVFVVVDRRHVYMMIPHVCVCVCLYGFVNYDLKPSYIQTVVSL